MSLLKNNKYDIEVTIAGQKFSEYFYSKLDPLYNTITAVRNSDIGPHLGDVTDEEILLKLFEISKKTDTLFENNDDLSWDEDELPPVVVRQYTLAKTKLDLLLYRVYYSNHQFDSASLADFDVDSTDYDQIKPLVDDLKQEVSGLESELGGGKASPRSVLKSADSNPYPFSDRQF